MELRFVLKGCEDGGMTNLFLHAMKLRQSYVQDRRLRLVLCGRMCDGLTTWQMYVISFAFGQCKHGNSTMY